MSEQGELQGLPLEGLDITPTPEQIAGKIANQIFRPWYKQYYEGRYTQSTAFIAKVLKQTVLKCVVEGNDNEAIITRAMQMLGLKQQVVTEASLQYALSVARREDESRKQASIWHDEKGANESNDNTESSTDSEDAPEVSAWGKMWEEMMQEDDDDENDNDASNTKYAW